MPVGGRPVACKLEDPQSEDRGRNVLVATNVLLTDSLHCYEDPSVPIMRQPVVSNGPVVIEDDCWLGFGCVVLPGVVVGMHSVVGANAVVVSSVPPFSVVVGSPARVVRQWNPSTAQWERR